MPGVHTGADLDTSQFADDLHELVTGQNMIQDIDLSENVEALDERTRTVSVTWVVGDDNEDLLKELPFDGGEA